MTESVTKEMCLQAILTLAPLCPDLKRTIETDGYRELASASWARAFIGFTKIKLQTAVDFALKNHKERNITPAHLLKYWDKALEDEGTLEKIRGRIVAEKQESLIQEGPAVPFEDLPEETKAQLRKFTGEIGGVA